MVNSQHNPNGNNGKQGESVMRSIQEYFKEKAGSGHFDVKMTGDGVTVEGQRAIASLLNEWLVDNSDSWASRMWTPPALPRSWDWSLVTNTGYYRGRLPKRISAYYSKAYNIRLPESLLSSIGNLVNTHKIADKKLTIDIVTRFSWQAGDFGDSGSCYWSYNTHARNMLRQMGACAIRFWEQRSLHRQELAGYGRLWVVPILGDCVVLYNLYGLHGEMSDVAKIVVTSSGIDGLSYKRIDLSNNGDTGGTLYINSGMGYLIGPADKIAGIDSHDFKKSPYDQTADDLYPGDDDDGCTTCDHCGYRIYDDDDSYNMANGDILCNSCYERHGDYCESCQEYVYQNDMAFVDNTAYCNACIVSGRLDITRCDECYEYHHDDNMTRVNDGDYYYCQSCLDDHAVICESCMQYVLTDDADALTSEEATRVLNRPSSECHLCNDCYDSKTTLCRCGHIDNAAIMGGDKTAYDDDGNRIPDNESVCRDCLSRQVLTGNIDLPLLPGGLALPSTRQLLPDGSYAYNLSMMIGG